MYITGGVQNLWYWWKRLSGCGAAKPVITFKSTILMPLNFFCDVPTVCGLTSLNAPWKSSVILVQTIYYTQSLSTTLCMQPYELNPLSLAGANSILLIRRIGSSDSISIETYLDHYYIMTMPVLSVLKLSIITSNLTQIWFLWAMERVHLVRGRPQKCEYDSTPS